MSQLPSRQPVSKQLLPSRRWLFTSHAFDYPGWFIQAWSQLWKQKSSLGSQRR